MSQYNCSFPAGKLNAVVAYITMGNKPPTPAATFDCVVSASRIILQLHAGVCQLRYVMTKLTCEDDIYDFDEHVINLSHRRIARFIDHMSRGCSAWLWERGSKRVFIKHSYNLITIGDHEPGSRLDAFDATDITRRSLAYALETYIWLCYRVFDIPPIDVRAVAGIAFRDISYYTLQSHVRLCDQIDFTIMDDDDERNATEYRCKGGWIRPTNFNIGGHLVNIESI